MDESNTRDFIGYEYINVTTQKSKEALYVDSYKNFGWELESSSSLFQGSSNISLEFKRDRMIPNKAELGKLQRQFDSNVEQIESYERSKTTNASFAAYVVGIAGCAFMAGAVFSYLAGMLVAMVIFAIPGALCWTLPYFLYIRIQRNKANQIAPLIENKYDAIYDISKKANNLLAA